MKLDGRKATTTQMNHSADESTMRAIVQDRYGPAEVLRPARIGRPVIADHEVLIRVHAAGLDRGTRHLMTGTPYLMRVMGYGFRRPKNRVPGLDVAGTVVAVGPAVTRFAVGDEVFGMSRGSFAEYAAAREDKLAHKPANASFEQAAAVGISGGTALQALTAGRVQAGQRVLIIGASGGVGSFAVQLAKASGAEVTGVCSTNKLDLVTSLGADRVVDYTREDFAAGSHHYDLIVDIAGNSPLSRLRRALTPTGTAVIVGGESKGNLTGGIDRQLRALILTRFVGQRLTGLASKERASDLEILADHLAAGTVTPSIDRTYPLDQVPTAMRYLEAGKVKGKIAITI
jgi:NADPH:quinone reductase-like Zn-dependent oxidoreductase